MKLDQKYRHPLNFADNVDSGSHVVLFYENLEYAQEIQFRFLWRGLERNEICIYGTYDEPWSVMSAMTEHKIDVKRWKNKGLLRIVDLGAESARKVNSSARALQLLLDGVSKPYRMVCTLARELDDPGEIKANMEIESKMQGAFSHGHASGDLSLLCAAKGSLMCPYDISGIEPELHGNWLVSLIKSHDAAVFAPKSGDGIVLGRLSRVRSRAESRARLR